MVYITALVFTVLSYYARNNLAFPVLAGLSWLVTGVSLVHVQIVGFDTMGNGHTYSIVAALETTKVGQLATVFLFAGISTVMFLLTSGWAIRNKRVGDDI